MSNAAMREAMAIHTPGNAKNRPGQILTLVNALCQIDYPFQEKKMILSLSS
jgi:hypothetical protein